jgi:hypothetical protein
LNPALPDDDFDAAVRIAQAEFDRGKPDVVVGSSRGGAVAMNIKAGKRPLVMLCPAWKRWGTATKVKARTVILHSPDDEVVPFEDSEELLRNSRLPESALIPAGREHRLADKDSLTTMLEACEQWDARFHAIHESAHALVGYRLGLTPKTLRLGRTSTGTSGSTEFCSWAALNRNPHRWLVIAVAGKVGTQVLGYRNRLVSENLAELEDDEEPGSGGDEWRVWEENQSLEAIQEAEEDARKILERNHSLLTALAEALIDKGELRKDDIRAEIARCSAKR